MNDFTDGMTISQGKEVIALLEKILARLDRIEKNTPPLIVR